MQGSKTTSNTVFFSLKDLNEGIKPVEQIQKGREILENKIKQYIEIMDKIESKESAKEVIDSSLRFFIKIKTLFNSPTHLARFSLYFTEQYCFYFRFVCVCRMQTILQLVF